MASLLTDLAPAEAETRVVWIDTLDDVIAGDVQVYLGMPVTLAELDIREHFDAERIATLRAEVEVEGRIIEPLNIHCHPDGSLILRDGHHRYVVARDLNLPVIAVAYHHGYYTADGDIDYPTDHQW